MQDVCYDAGRGQQAIGRQNAAAVPTVVKDEP